MVYLMQHGVGYTHQPLSCQITMSAISIIDLKSMKIAVEQNQN